MNTRLKSHSQSEINSKKIFGIHGGGNIGLGLMADIVSRSENKYEIIATSNNEFTNQLINVGNKLWLQHDANNLDDTTCVNNVRMISRNTEDIVNLYCKSSLVALCITPAVMPNVANDIALGLINRYNIYKNGLQVLILMNLPNCGQFAREKILEAILLNTGNEVLAKKIISLSEFIPTVIDRIVTPIPEDKVKAQLKNQLLKINRNQLLFECGNSNIDNIIKSPTQLKRVINRFNLKFNLFNAEKSFSMHVPETFVESRRFPLMTPTKNLNVIEAVKNKYINGPHAILAWTGALLGYQTIAEAINHPGLLNFIKEMMEQEIAPILCTEYPSLSHKDLEILEKNFFKRCLASVNDPISRVGRDPLRKLDKGGRVRGTIELAKKHNLAISTEKLEQGLASGFLYGMKFDPNNPGCKKIREIYTKSNQSYRAVLCYRGVAPSGSFTGLSPNKDERLINNILSYISYFNTLHEKQTAIIKQPIPHEALTYNNNLTAVSNSNLFFSSDNKQIKYFPKNNPAYTLSNNVKHLIWYKSENEDTKHMTHSKIKMHSR